jgi:phage terminase large subunit-like protein
MISKINQHILQYIEAVENGIIEACEDQHLLVAHVRKCFEAEDINTDDEQLKEYLGLVKYFDYEQLFDWEEFVFALHCCTYRVDGMPRWPDLLLVLGRGAGKDGYIAFESLALSSPYNGIKHYDVDICANSEEQAKAPFNDIWNCLEDPRQTKKLKKHYYWNKEEILNLKTKSKIKYRTNNPKGKDGLRSGIVVFNEIHQYEDYANINVFTTGLGKKKHPRRTYATTQGDVRDGPLDDYMSISEQILNGAIEDNGFLPFVCRLNDKKDVDDPKNWDMANPSLKYLPNLQEEIRKEYIDWKRDPSQFSAFMTKRMNMPDGNKNIEVTSWENIIASCGNVPDLSGRNGVVGIDYASVTDFASAGILIRNGDMRYWITHSWVCTESLDLPRIKAPLKEWGKKKLLTFVDDAEINPDLIAEWIAEQAIKYNLMKLALDNFRYPRVAESVNKIGFNYKERKNIKLVRPSDVMMIEPVIKSCFIKHNFAWGDNPLMRWAVNNSKKIKSGRKEGTDTGNYYYGKIESKSRKTDPFMALVAAMAIESELGDGGSSVTPDYDVATY